jgi:hypothetical protein
VIGESSQRDEVLDDVDEDVEGREGVREDC